MAPFIPPTARYTDLSLAFNANPVTGDVTTLTDDDAIKASVVNLVFTMNYEIPFHAEQGCAVYHSLFENISPMTAAKIRRSILDVLNNYEPRIIVQSVNVVPSPDQNSYNAFIVYQIIGQPLTTAITIFLEKLR
jgi:phage baseplate assembly protein W